MPGKYTSLYQYLENRYTNTVVLTFAHIEDLLAFPLPDSARVHREVGGTSDRRCGECLTRPTSDPPIHPIWSLHP